MADIKVARGFQSSFFFVREKEDSNLDVLWLQTLKLNVSSPFFFLNFLGKKNYHSRKWNIYVRETFTSKNKTSKTGGERFSIQVTSLKIYLTNLIKKCAIELPDRLTHEKKQSRRPASMSLFLAKYLFTLHNWLHMHS